MLTRAHYLLHIAECERRGFVHTAAALRQLCVRDFGPRAALSPLAHRPAPCGPFSLVTGRDFGRSLAWARTQPRPLAAFIAARSAALIAARVPAKPVA